MQTNSPLDIGRGNLDGKISNFRLFNKALNADQVKELYDYQKDYFLGSKSQVTLYKGHLGIGVAEPSGQLELAGDERIQEYPPGPLSNYETLIPGHGVFCAIASSTHYSTEGWKAFPPNSNGILYWASGYGLYSQTSGAAGGVYAGSQRLSATTELGEYLILELPYKIILSKVFISARSSHTFKAPSNFTIYGSNNNSDWYTLLTVTGATPSQSGGNYYPGGGDSGTSTSIGDTTPYKYLAIVVSKTAGGSDIGDGTNSPGSIDAMMIANISYFGTPGPTTLDKGSLTLGRSLDVPRISRYDVDTETPRPEKLVVDFDTTVNSSPTDISGQGKHGCLKNGASYSAADKAFNFDGTNDYIQTAPLGFSGDQVHSVSLWFWSDDEQSTFSTNEHALYGTGGVSNSTESGISLYNTYALVWRSAGGTVYPMTFNANQWNHVCMTYSSGGSVNSKLWLNGNELTQTTTSSSTYSFQASEYLIIGTWIDNATVNTSYTWDGKISNFKLYNVALEPSEVQKLYRLGRTGRSMVISDTAVGIGKVPEAQLDVRGRINATGSISSNNPSFSYWKIDQAGLEATVESPSGSQKAGFFQNFTQSFGQNHENGASAENRNSMFDPDSGTFHVPERGLYQLTFNFTMVDVSSSSGDETLEISFHISDNAPSEVRGTATDGTQKLNPALSTGSSLEEFWCLSECVRLETGASVRVYLKNIDTGNQFAVVKMNFSGFKIA
jgi:hypothetical protein